MPASVISIATKHRAFWSLLEVAPSGCAAAPYGILLGDEETGELTVRLRAPDYFGDLDEGEADILDRLAQDLDSKAREAGALELLGSLEDSLSGFFRISDRTAIACSDMRATADRLFDEHVDAGFDSSGVRPFITHLPLYGLRAAATKFGDGMDGEQEGWVRAPETLRLTEGMFVAYVTGRSMEPLIPDGSACIFRAPVTGSRRGRHLLIEKFGETDFDARYTVKRYARQGALAESEERAGAIRLEPLNREFEAFELASDEFRVVAEFVQVLQS
jgi:hypothetical protein